MENSRQANELTELIAVSGELPADAVYRLGGGRHYKTKLVSNMKDSGLIHLEDKDGLRGYRLNFSAKKMLLKKNRDRFEFYLTGITETNRIKSDITRRLRLHRIADVILTMYNAGIKLFRDEKPDVFNPGEDSFIEVTDPLFYTSREFKELNHDMVKVKNARAVGILLNEKEIYIVYNTENYNMKWDYKSEISVKAIMEQYLCRTRMPNQYPSFQITGLVFGNSMDMLYQIFTGGDKLKRSYFLLNKAFEKFIYLTNDKYGETGLKLLCDSEKQYRLNAILSGPLCGPDRGMLIENDALDKNGNPVLFSYLIDMPRLSRFVTALNMHDRNGGIVCFDFQEAILSKCCGERVYFDTINFARFKERFFE
ncbi:MAG: hypothetical protein FWD71_20305 [Oscillospiraceae bacterium]|nr:hypothetical protein [Oscillospiraceae bacterium]